MFPFSLPIAVVVDFTTFAQYECRAETSTTSERRKVFLTHRNLTNPQCDIEIESEEEKSHKKLWTAAEVSAILDSLFSRFFSFTMWNSTSFEFEAIKSGVSGSQNNCAIRYRHLMCVVEELKLVSSCATLPRFHVAIGHSNLWKF